jgi:2-polyprenyl-3-methyl-5-hydroxy-6-metoxy-1,4-benzoquinol methylase
MTNDQDLWRTYAGVYDALVREILPYQRLLRELVISSDVTTASNLLDAGCGTGNLLWALEHEDVRPRVTGLDNSEAMLELARPKGRDYGPADFRLVNLDDPVESWGVEGPFDVVVSNNSLYTLADPVATLRGLWHVSAPRAVLMASTPRANPDMQAVLNEHLSTKGGDAAAEMARLKPLLEPMIASNRQILERYGPETNHFPSAEQLYSWFDQAGWAVTDLTVTYAEQNWLVRARRQARK